MLYADPSRTVRATGYHYCYLPFMQKKGIEAKVLHAKYELWQLTFGDRLSATGFQRLTFTCADVPKLPA